MSAPRTITLRKRINILHLCSTDTGLQASGAGQAEDGEAGASTVLILADVGVAQSTLAADTLRSLGNETGHVEVGLNSDGDCAPHHGRGDQSTDGEVELHVGGWKGDECARRSD